MEISICTGKYKNTNNTLLNVFVRCDQLYMAVFFLYLVKKKDLSSVHVYSTVHATSHVLQGFRKTRPCLSGRVVHEEWAQDGQTQGTNR